MEEQVDQLVALVGSKEELASMFTKATGVGLNVIYAVIILLIGWWIANLTKRMLRRAMDKTNHVDDTIAGFASSLARYFVLAVVLIAVLQLFGIETTSLVAVLGATTLAIGLALQGTLSHVAAGVMLLLFRPFKIGDYVEIGGQAGTVKEITLFTTELATPDNVQIIMPNGEAWGSAVVNYSAHSTRRVDITIGIGYEDSMDKAMETFKAVIASEERIHKSPDPFVAITNLGDSAVDVTLRVWCAAGDYWGLKFDLTKNLKEALDAEGISIPYPQMDVHQIVAQPAAS
ncbi:MAG: mechanosensitive ion channel domain-containing protein [Stappiaceae bacterium]